MLIDKMGEKPDYWDEAVKALMARDLVLKKLISAYCDVWLGSKQTAFTALSRACIIQQMGEEKAQGVWGGFVKLCKHSVTPANVQTFNASQLKEIGITKRKADCLFDMAEHFASKKVNPSTWFRASDEQIIKEICAIKGIGIWTAQMFLIFNLHRPDVFPIDDPRLAQGISIHYFSGEPVSRSEIKEIAKNWSPWRTVATWYLWYSLGR